MSPITFGVRYRIRTSPLRSGSEIRRRDPRMGSAGESAAMGLLVLRDEDARKAACEVLEEIGTTRALPALKNVVNSSVRREARSAIQKIEARSK